MRPIALALALFLPLALHAQTPAELLNQARQAFDNLEFEQAARWYTRALDISAGATGAERDTAQLYLAVSYEYAGQRPNALSAFRALVRDRPCAQTPEQFGAGVTSAFVEARAGVFAAGLCEMRRQQLAPGSTAAFRVAATRPAMVRMLLRDSAGQTVADFGEQPVAGIAQVQWRNLPDPGRFGERPARYELVVRARAQQGAETDERFVLLLAHAPAVDTLPHPPPIADSAFRPELTSMGPVVGDFAKGLGIAVALAATTAALSYQTLKGETGKALAVGGAISFASVVGLATGSRKREIPGSRAHNAELRRAWEASRDSVMATNRQRLLSRPLVLEPVPEGR